MHELGALDLGAEDDADRDVFADLPADAVEDLREEIFGPEPVAEGIFVDREEGSESEAASSEGSSSSAEEGCIAQGGAWLCRRGRIAQRVSCPRRRGRGWCPLRGRPLAQQPSIQTLAQS